MHCYPQTSRETSNDLEVEEMGGNTSGHTGQHSNSHKYFFVPNDGAVFAYIWKQIPVHMSLALSLSPESKGIYIYTTVDFNLLSQSTANVIQYIKIIFT